MHTFDESQRNFAEALLNQNSLVPQSWVDPTGAPSARRFGVYRNNVLAGLARTLADAYPVVHLLVGEEFFHAMACVYVGLELPCSPILSEYGKGFPDFIESFEPAATLPYLADVARMERAWVESYHAPDAVSMRPEALVSFTTIDFERVRVVLHPSVRTVQSAFPARSIWEWHQGGQPEAAAFVQDAPQDTLLVRPAAMVEVVSLRPGAADFVESLAQGEDPCSAFARAIHRAPSFDLASALSELASHGVFAACHRA